MSLQCSICISTFKDPVCLPCGHLYCKKCLADHVNVPTNMGMTSTCPDCRSTFHIAIPDLTYLPNKYHPFVTHAVRRVYIDVASQFSLQEELEEAKKLILKMKEKEIRLKNRNEELIGALSTTREKAKTLTKVAAEYSSTIDELEGTKKMLEKQCSRESAVCKVLASRVAQLKEQLAQNEDLSSSDDKLAPLSPRQSSPDVPNASVRTRAIRPIPRRKLQRRVREESDSPPPHFGQSKKPRLSALE